MNKMTSGVVTGALALLSGVAAAYLHKAGLSAWLGDPDTAAAVTSFITGAMGLAAGFMKGWKS